MEDQHLLVTMGNTVCISNIYAKLDFIKGLAPHEPALCEDYVVYTFRRLVKERHQVFASGSQPPGPVGAGCQARRHAAKPLLLTHVLTCHLRSSRDIFR